MPPAIVITMNIKIGDKIAESFRPINQSGVGKIRTFYANVLPAAFAKTKILDCETVLLYYSSMTKNRFKMILLKVIVICVVITVMKDFLNKDTAYSVIPVGLKDSRYCCLAGCPPLDPVDAYRSSQADYMTW